MTRLLLFDIDGTLVTGGPAKEAFRIALMEAFGTAGDITLHDFAGKTDPQIARELLRGAGLDDAAIASGLPALWTTYLGELERRLPATPMRALPGVAALVEALALAEDVALGLVTGNIADGARLKLGSVGLHERFPFGGFGSDSEERDYLPGVALARARDLLRVELAPEDVVVVGDTPRDVACGRCHGMRTLAVATGRFGVDELRASGADEVLKDLTDIDRVMEVLTTRVA
jgi:phosphoglycolate phosphatase-like HAD superfamily hydrolase